jgi:uncharacterized membrane protein YdcZ (DUF606 family)
MTMTDTMSAATNRRPVAAWAAVALAAFFGLLYAYDLWEAISNLASITQVYELFGLAPTDAPWWLLIVGALVPVVVFGLALWLSRGRGLLGRALVFTTGLMVVAVVSLDIVALEGVIRRTLY